MGNFNSAQQKEGGELCTAGVPSHQALQLPLPGSSKTWATTDHTLSGPWSFLVKEEVQCLCEGARNCTRENPARQRGPNAVPGLHSNWVGEHVLAMARPWQENVLKHGLVSRFKELNIGMILNLQEVGEHESCGPGNLASSGFTYNPETFMAAKVSVFNFSWRDMGVPTLDKMMDIVQVMQYLTMVEGRKVAVHCHAGLGRTGLAIACFLVASGQASSAAHAIELVRAARPGALQTQAQVVFVSIFEQYLQHLRCLFKVADLKHLSLGNTNYIVTKVCRRISRSMSGSHHLSSSCSGTPDALAAAAAAALGPLTLHSSTGSAGSGANSAPGSATAAAAAAAQLDWTSATYELMTPAEAAQLTSSAQAAAANAALNLGPAASAGGPGKDGLVMHARRLSAGGSIKLVSNLKAIEEEGDKPVHVIQTDNAVTEVYGHGLTIIRATDSARKLQAGPTTNSSQQRVEQLLTPTELGLDKQLPWTDRFVIRPEAFKAEGWLPEPPSSYVEALRRQQRLLHGVERRRCLHLHKLLRAAVKALTAAAQAYNSVPQHNDSRSVPVAGSPPPGATFKRMHTRSRSNAAAVDLLAVAAGGLALTSDAVLSTGGSAQQQPAGASVAAITAAASSLLSKHHQQHQHMSSGGSPAAAADLAGKTAAALLPGIYLGPPGTKQDAAGACNASCNNSTNGSTGCGTEVLRALPRDGSTQGDAATGAGLVASCTPCLAGCCAPSFAVGLLLALLYKGRFPEEYEAQWSNCPRLKALGLDEGHAMCQTLQDVKLAVNAGAYGPLEAAPGAVVVCVLADWFEGFSSEALGEPTLELLVDEAENLLAEALAAKGAAGQDNPAHQQQHHQQKAAAAAETPSSNDTSYVQSHRGPQVPAEADFFLPVDDDVPSRSAAAQALCSALLPYEQDLCLILAAGLRHARHASLDDSRQQQQHEVTGSNSNSASGSCTAVVEAQVDAAMAVLYRLVAGWLLGPLALACAPALEAVAAFLHFITVDDVAYSALLKASTKSIRRANTAPGKLSQPWLDGPTSPRRGTQPKQQQQQLDMLDKFKTRLLGGGSRKQVKDAGQSGYQAPAGQLSGGAASVGKSKLSHSSSSPELTNQQAAVVAQHPKSKLGSKSSKAASKSSKPARSQAVDNSDERSNGVLPGCGTAFSLLLGQKLQGISSKKQQQHGEPAAGALATAAAASAVASQTQQQVQEHVQQQQQQQNEGSSGVSCRVSGSSSAADSSSEVIHGGTCQELCVGQQRQQQQQQQASAAAYMDEELAVLSGHRVKQQQADGSMDQSGVLSPPQSVSPRPHSPTGSRQSGSGRHHLHLHLPGQQHHATAVSPSSATSSPYSSMGSITSLLLSAQHHSAVQDFQQQQQGDTHSRFDRAAGLEAGFGAGLGAAGASDAQGLCSSGTDVSSSQALSVSALSELHLASLAPSVSLGGPGPFGQQS